MIDTDLLRHLGWSDALIDAAKQVARPMRGIPGLDFQPPTTSVNAGGCVAVYADSVTNTASASINVAVRKSEESIAKDTKGAASS